MSASLSRPACPTSNPTTRRSDRRRFLRAVIGATVTGAFPGAGRASKPSAQRMATGSDAAHSSHFPFGPVVPARPIPPWPVLTHQSRATDLGSLLRGRTTALQLMFTGCSATCPIQGALFAQAQRELQDRPPRAQLVSLSIDPLADTPAALTAWLRQFSALPGWLAAVPRPADVEAVFELLGSGGESRPGGSDRHTGQVYIVDRHVQLVYRTESMPDPAKIVALLRLIDDRP